MLDEATRITLFRALRELLMNVVKHAKAREARVCIWRDGAVARVSVDDSGAGFDPAAKHLGFGLLALRERVGQMSGSVTIESAVGRGTRVVVSVPVASRDVAAGGST